MSESTLWWIVAGVLVSLELLTGTFYLLMLALGGAAAALTAMAGAPQSAQLVIAALVGGGAVWLWHRRQSRHPSPRRTAQSASIDPGNLDAGAHVMVDAWSPDGTARVSYRGTEWSARCHGTQTPAAGPHRIKTIDNNVLILERI